MKDKNVLFLYCTLLQVFDLLFCSVCLQTLDKTTKSTRLPFEFCMFCYVIYSFFRALSLYIPSPLIFASINCVDIFARFVFSSLYFFLL